MTTATTPVTVIGGYLGAGKTTFINRLLHETNQRLVVVVNDFGSVNVDASLISAQHNDTIELTNGCICCAISGSLADVMLDISDREIQPDGVIIECSGVADPMAVSANTYIGGFHLSSIMTFVDAENWKTTARDSLVKEIFWRQIDSADVLILSKLDVVSPSDEELLRSALTERQPSVPLLDSLALSPAQLLNPAPAGKKAEHLPLVGHNFTSEVLHPDSTLTRQEIETYVRTLPGNVVRAKGVVALDTGAVLVQRVGKRVVITDTLLSPTGIVVITAD